MAGTPLEDSGRGRLRRNRSGDDQQIQIKGMREGLAVTLGEGDWGDLLRALAERLERSAAFFRNSQVHPNTGRRDLEESDLRELLQVLEAHHIALGRLHTSSRVTAASAQALEVRIGLPEPERALPELPTATEEWSEGLLFHRTLRSGQSLRHPGHVIIIGDVNPGAEVIAGGDVVVWGRLRGAVHAGAAGNDESLVCALDLRPMQLRIGSHIATELGKAPMVRDLPGEALVSGDQIVARPWTLK